MAKKGLEKTNVMRILDQKRIPYTAHTYPHGNDPIDGVTVASIIQRSPDQVFKTLVARGASKNIYVFVVPVAMEMDLKKAAKAAGEKSVAMIHVSEITPLTGYVRGGCSPIGMKKSYSTFFDESCLLQETMIVSAGKIGYQIETAPMQLVELTCGNTADLTVESSLEAL